PQLACWSTKRSRKEVRLRGVAASARQPSQGSWSEGIACLAVARMRSTGKKRSAFAAWPLRRDSLRRDHGAKACPAWPELACGRRQKGGPPSRRGRFGETAFAGIMERRLAPQAGLEPATLRLTAGCSAIELLRNTEGRD